MNASLWALLQRAAADIEDKVEQTGNHEGGADGPSGSRSQAGMSRSAWSRRQMSTWSARST